MTLGTASLAGRAVPSQRPDLRLEHIYVASSHKITLLCCLTRPVLQQQRLEGRGGALGALKLQNPLFCI